MIAEVLKWGIGKIPVRQAEAFVRESSAFLRNPDKPGRVTTSEVYAEEKQIIETLQASKAAHQPIIIAPVHRDGKDFAGAIRDEMKGEGTLGWEDQEIARLEICDLSEAQKADSINYEVGQVIECHRKLKGDLRPGEQWEVTQVLRKLRSSQETVGKSLCR